MRSIDASKGSAFAAGAVVMVNGADIIRPPSELVSVPLLATPSKGEETENLCAFMRQNG